jgi:hypothetical protein
MTSRFAIDELQGATLAEPFDFTKGVPVLKLKPRANDAAQVVEVQGMSFEETETRLYDLYSDPGQTTPIDDPVTETRMIVELTRLMRETDAPPEMFDRFGLNQKEAADA